MLFSAILFVFIGFISFFLLRMFSGKKPFDVAEGITRSIVIAVLLSIGLLIVKRMIFHPMFKLQTYCKSEPDNVIELVDVSETCRNPVSKDYADVANSLNAGKKFVVTDGEFYYYCYTIVLPKEKKMIIEKIKVSDEIQVEEPSFLCTGAMVKIYHYKYVNWWGKFFFDNPYKERLVFLIPKGTLGKGKIIYPDPAPIYVPAG